MNSQEYESLRNPLAQLLQIRGVRKDPEANASIQAAVAQQSDVTYLLTQCVMLLCVALDKTRACVAELGPEEQRSRSDYVGSGVAREPLAAPSAGSSLPMFARAAGESVGALET